MLDCHALFSNTHAHPSHKQVDTYTVPVIHSTHPLLIRDLGLATVHQIRDITLDKECEYVPQETNPTAALSCLCIL
jgi:hypothetical protein